MIGKVFNNRYKIIDKLGSGGTAIVYRGQDLLLNRIVTIKILREEYASNQDFVRRFRHEAQAVASLAHNNIVAVYDVGFEEDMHYIVMEYIDGETLKEYLRRKGVLSVAEACRIISQILAGLQHAHESGIIHRDIKSQNIMMSKDGKAKVTDFGIAVGMTDVTLTYNTSSRIMGSVHYISPEQVQGQTVTEKTDIYAVGVIFYELLTGRLPFLGETPISIAMQHVQGELVLPHQINPEVSMGVSYVVVRAMRKNAEARFDSAKAMSDAVRTAYEGEMNGESTEPLNEDEDFDVVIANSIANGNSNSNGNGNGNGNAKPKKKKKKFVWTRKKIIIATAIAVGVIGGFWGIAFATGLIGGEDMAVVPDVVGIDEQDATQALEDLGLLAEIKYRNSEEDVGTVLEQGVAPDTEVSLGRTIELIVSEGEETVAVPDVVGSTLKIAELTLENKELAYTTSEEYSDEAPKNEIIYQSPEANKQVPLGTVIELVVSLGPEPKNLSMPDLRGMTMVEAESVIDAYNFVIDTSFEESHEYLKGQIIKQSISPGTTTQTGAELSLTISDGPGPPQKKTATTSWTVTDDVSPTPSVRMEVEDETGTTDIYPLTVHDAGDVIEEFNFNFYGSGVLRIYEDGALMYTRNLG